MTDKPIFTTIEKDEVEYVGLLLPIEVNGKKTVKIITLDCDEFEMHETGTKDKNGKPVQYYKFKVIE